MGIIRVRNNITDTAEFTSLSNGESAGVTALRVKNLNAAQLSWAIQIGATGVEQSEIRVLSTGTPSGTVGTVTAATSYDHPADTPVYFTKFDKVIIKRSTSGTAGTATALATISITPDSFFTQYDDTSGAASYAYKATYYNSVTTETSTDSDWITSTGFSSYSLGGMRQRVKDKLFSSAFISDDSVIDNWINEWSEMMNNAVTDVNEDYNLGSVNVGFGTSSFGALGTITSSDFKDVRRLWFTTNGTDYIAASRKEINDYSPNQVFSESRPFYYHFGDSVLGKLPATAGTAQVVYYRLPTRLSNDGDELPISMRGYTKSFVDYALAQAYYLDKNPQIADRYKEDSYTQLERFRTEISSRTKSGPSYINFVTEIDDDQLLDWY